MAAGLLNHNALRGYGTFDALARLANRLPVADREEPALGVEQRPVTISRTATAGRLLEDFGDRPVGDLLLPRLPVMMRRPGGRVARLLGGTAQPAPQDPVFSGYRRRGRETSARLATNRPTEPGRHRRAHRPQKYARGIAIRNAARGPASQLPTRPLFEASLTPARQATCARVPHSASPCCPRSTPRRPPPASPRARTRRQRDAGADRWGARPRLQTWERSPSSPHTGTPGAGGDEPGRPARDVPGWGRTAPTGPRSL